MTCARHRSGILAAALAIGLCAAPAAQASFRSLLDGYLAARGTAEHISAVALHVTYAGHRPNVDLAAGTTRYGAGRPLSTQAYWPIGSNTKAFTAVLLLKLEAEHKLSIHDTLGRWLPQYPAWRDVTVEQLLNMTSGIANYSAQPAFKAAMAASRATRYSESRLVSYAVGLPLETGWHYSNTNYVLAQMIVERATHHSYATELRRRILAPLGLRATFFTAGAYPPAVNARIPSGYFFDPVLPSIVGQDQRGRNLSYAQGSGGIVSSLADLATWARALYRGPLLPAGQRRELESLISESSGKPITTVTEQDRLGFGLGVSRVSDAGRSYWYYEGTVFGYRVVHLYAPRSGAVIVVAANSMVAAADDGLGDLARIVLRRLGVPR